MMINDNISPARLHAILAREAGKAVILRRSPKFLGSREILPPPPKNLPIEESSDCSQSTNEDVSVSVEI